MKVENNRAVTLNYRLRLDSADGELVEETYGKEDPLKFIYGRGMMIPKFEEELLGLKAGDHFSFLVTADQGYGDYNKDLVLEVTRERFGAKKGEEVPVGEQVKVSSPEGGTHIGVVINSDEENVYVDFNPPMAGKNLYFEGDIISVAAAPPMD